MSECEQISDLPPGYRWASIQYVYEIHRRTGAPITGGPCPVEKGVQNLEAVLAMTEKAWEFWERDTGISREQWEAMKLATERMKEVPEIIRGLLMTIDLADHMFKSRFGSSEGPRVAQNFLHSMGVKYGNW